MKDRDTSIRSEVDGASAALSQRALTARGDPPRRRLVDLRIPRFLTLLAFLALAALIPLTSAGAADPTPQGQWYQVELHAHSVTSGDGVPDEGINATAMKAAGYDAGFVTDHQATSNDVIGSVIANHVFFDDSLVSAGDTEQWDTQAFGASASNTIELVSSPVNAGTKSLAPDEHLSRGLCGVVHQPQARSGPARRADHLEVLDQPDPDPRGRGRLRLGDARRRRDDSPAGRRTASPTRPAQSTPAAIRSWSGRSATRDRRASTRPIPPPGSTSSRSPTPRTSGTPTRSTSATCSTRSTPPPPTNRSTTTR